MPGEYVFHYDAGKCLIASTEVPSQFSQEYCRLFGVPPGRDGQTFCKMLMPQVDV